MVVSYKKSLIERFEKFKEKGLLLLEKSSIEPSVNINSSIIFIGPDHPWGELNQDSKRLQNEVYNEYKHLIEIGRNILVRALPENKEKYEEESKTILDILEQSKMTFCNTVEEATKDFKESLNNQVALINSVHGNIGEGKLLIPDANVLINNPNLHEYKIMEKCNILLLPTILGELDKLKVEHSNENVREKAQTSIRNIKEFRRRGSLLAGVKVNDKIVAYSVAIEPNFKEKPYWLDPNNEDDRFLASCFEVASTYPDTEITILTLDINMQNKAEYALFAYVDPIEEGFF